MALALPIPEPAPVTSATFPWTLMTTLPFPSYQSRASFLRVSIPWFDGILGFEEKLIGTDGFKVTCYN
jgi:hypothetical protein